MWWKVTLAVLGLIVVFFIGGLYAGAATFLQLTTGSMAGMSLMTLIEVSEQSSIQGLSVYLPWSWAVTAAITFLPVGMTLLLLMGRIKGPNDLHGNARFANNKEMEQFAYRGEYH